MRSHTVSDHRDRFSTRKRTFRLMIALDKYRSPNVVWHCSTRAHAAVCGSLTDKRALAQERKTIVWDDTGNADPTEVGCSGCGEVYEEESRDEWCRAMRKSGQSTRKTHECSKGLVDIMARKTVHSVCHRYARSNHDISKKG